MKFRITPAKDGFEIKDENDTVYGPFANTKKQAEEILQDWVLYYESPLEEQK